MKNTNTAGGAGLYAHKEGQSYSKLYESAKFEQKRINDKRVGLARQASDLNKQLQKSHGKPFCLKGVSVGYCPEGTVIYRPVYCEKEGCEFCGQDGSPAHFKRINAVAPTVLKWKALTYLVITIPEEIRSQYYQKDKLNKFRTFIRRKLKADGFTQAAMRWHWAGSCSACKGKKSLKDNCLVCRGTGAGDTYHPHLNILLPAGNSEDVKCYTPGRYDLPKKYLADWRKSLENYFKKHHPDKPLTVGNIWHGFVPPVGTAVKTRDGKYRPLTEKIYERKVRHKLKYVFRATLRDPVLVSSFELILKKYKNTTRIGQWEEVAPEPAICHCCNQELKWYNERADRFWDNWHTLTEIKPGVYFRDYLKDREDG